MGEKELYGPDMALYGDLIPHGSDAIFIVVVAVVVVVY